jgi:hypothetical protein
MSGLRPGGAPLRGSMSGLRALKFNTILKAEINFRCFKRSAPLVKRSSSEALVQRSEASW